MSGGSCDGGLEPSVVAGASAVAGIDAADAARISAMSAARMTEVAALSASGDRASCEAGDAAAQGIHVALAARAQLFRRGEAATTACTEEQMLARGSQWLAMEQLGHRDVAGVRRRCRDLR